MKTQVFHRQVIQKVLLALHSHYTIDTPYRVWFDLDNSLTRWKRPIFKTPFSRSSKNSVWNTNFFPSQALPKFFLLYTLITLVILHTEFGLILTIAWPDEKEIFLKFSKICNSRNSQNSVWKPNFFPRQAIPKFFFAFNSHYARDTLYRVWFDLDNSLTRWKKLFLKFPKIRNSRNSQNTVWKPKFFTGKLYQKSFLFYTLITLLTLHTAFGSIWTTP